MRISLRLLDDLLLHQHDVVLLHGLLDLDLNRLTLRGTNRSHPDFGLDRLHLDVAFDIGDDVLDALADDALPREVDVLAHAVVPHGVVVDGRQGGHLGADVERAEVVLGGVVERREVQQLRGHLRPRVGHGDIRHEPDVRLVVDGGAVELVVRDRAADVAAREAVRGVHDVVARVAEVARVGGAEEGGGFGGVVGAHLTQVLHDGGLWGGE